MKWTDLGNARISLHKEVVLVVFDAGLITKGFFSPYVFGINGKTWKGRIEDNIESAMRSCEESVKLLE